MFQWIRTKVRNAVLAGVADAVDYLESSGASGGDGSQDRLESATILRLAGPETLEPAAAETGKSRRGKVS